MAMGAPEWADDSLGSGRPTQGARSAEEAGTLRCRPYPEGDGAFVTRRDAWHGVIDRRPMPIRAGILHSTTGSIVWLRMTRSVLNDKREPFAGHGRVAWDARVAP
jgi:hypothetical protein